MGDCSYSTTTNTPQSTKRSISTPLQHSTPAATTGNSSLYAPTIQITPTSGSTNDTTLTDSNRKGYNGPTADSPSSVKKHKLTKGNIGCIVVFPCINIIGYVNENPTMQYFTGITGNTQSKSYMLSLIKCVWDFPDNALWDSH